ncbi:uncharacterized protein LOC128883105 [Hylaeus volcanicus]|uniref:uncharacterized protein LOC128883105 n=1 Tax=Hylaeus volcanicus TaxID=313075 RepID=UPI0023B7B77C|nr:uncharacterized protein LOC128883105 [Hylaeus volcanicus]
MVMASWGSEKLLVPGIYRAFTYIIPPSRVLCTLDSVPQITLQNLCLGLVAYGKLYAQGQLSLSKINSMLTYKANDPDIMRIIRLRIYNMMAESQPSDAVESLSNIQTALKDPNDVVNSEALLCLCRLCCRNMLYFHKVWTILNGKQYFTTMLTVEGFTNARIQAVSTFLKEYTLREVIPNLVKCRETYLTCGASDKKPFPPDITTAIQIMDVLILMLQTQLTKARLGQEVSEFHLTSSNLTTLIEACGLLVEQFYLVSEQETLWTSFFVIPSTISCIIQKFIENLSFQHKSCSSISETTWTKLLEPNFILDGSASSTKQTNDDIWSLIMEVNRSYMT